MGLLLLRPCLLTALLGTYIASLVGGPSPSPPLINPRKERTRNGNNNGEGKKEFLAPYYYYFFSLKMWGNERMVARRNFSFSFFPFARHATWPPYTFLHSLPFPFSLLLRLFFERRERGKSVAQRKRRREKPIERGGGRGFLITHSRWRLRRRGNNFSKMQEKGKNQFSQLKNFHFAANIYKRKFFQHCILSTF